MHWENTWWEFKGLRPTHAVKRWTLHLKKSQNVEQYEKNFKYCILCIL